MKALKDPVEQPQVIEARLSYNVRAFATYIESIKDDKAQIKKVELEIDQLMKTGAKQDDIERKLA